MTPGAVLVTGSAKRLGRAMALDLASQGWKVALHYNGSAADAEAAAQDALSAGAPAAAALQADLLSENATHQLVARAAEALSAPLTLLVNNASIFEDDNIRTSTRESWDRHLESNLRAPYVLIQNFANQCPPAEEIDGEPIASGLVVNMIDQRVWKPTPAFSSYTIAKMGLWALTRTAAQGLAPQIRVNGIGPGPTMANPRQSNEHFTKQRGGTILKRGADATDITAALRYLISARAVTGQMIAVDGGQHLAWQTPDILGLVE
ncbi:MAG: SDR family oxidoreductase [Rhodobacteraceae bacterium]|nr:SDR family oxidoreductase [Paracoccaceae bacterium]